MFPNTKETNNGMQPSLLRSNKVLDALCITNYEGLWSCNSQGARSPPPLTCFFSMKGHAAQSKDMWPLQYTIYTFWVYRRVFGGRSATALTAPLNKLSTVIGWCLFLILEGRSNKETKSSTESGLSNHFKNASNDAIPINEFGDPVSFWGGQQP